MKPKRRWTVALAVMFFSGCATGSNTQVLTPSHAPARGNEGALSAWRRHDPMQAKGVPARVQPTGAPDERLVRYFPAMDGQANGPTAAQPAGRPRLAPRPSGSPGAQGAGRPIRDTREAPLSTLPVSVTVGLRTPPLPRPNAGVPAVAQRPRDAAVVPTSADLPAPGETAPPILPNDLSFSRPEDRTAPAARTAAKPVAPAALPAPVPAPEPAQPETVAETPRFVEPMLVVAAPAESDAAPAPPARPTPARPDSASASEAEPEPKLETSVVIPPPTPVAKPADAPTVAEQPGNRTEPDWSRIPRPVTPPLRSSEPATPTALAAADKPRNAPVPAPTLPEPPSAPGESAPARTVVPTMATVADAQGTTQPAPALPSKQMPRLSPQSLCDRPNPAPRPRLFASLWPIWLRPDSRPSAAPAPRPALVGRPQPTPQPALAGNPSPAPRSFLASLRPTWLRPRPADVPNRAQPIVAAAPARQPTAPASAAKPVPVTEVVAKTVHGHGCSHHVCHEGEASPWLGASRALDTGVCYETMVRRPGTAPFAAPPAPPVASAAKPARPASPAPPVASVAKPVRPAPSPAVARIPTSSPAPAAASVPRPAQPQRVGLITRLWNRLTGTVATVPATMTAPPPGVAPVYGRAAPSRDPVAGNLPKYREPVERVSGERVDEATQR